MEAITQLRLPVGCVTWGLLEDPWVAGVISTEGIHAASSGGPSIPLSTQLPAEALAFSQHETPGGKFPCRGVHCV